jgi:RNA polymerase sigma factor (sigma-70 family)
VNPAAVARPATSAPDGVLVQQAAAGGGSSYATLYDRYSEQVYNYCLRLTGSPHDAADATQDAFVNVLGRLHRDDSPVLDFSSYLFAAARNESYALMRRRSRTEPTYEAPELAPPEPDVETDPERAALLRDSQEAVREANAQLAPRHREVLALREVAGRSYEEIGAIMGISENAAAQLIWRARSKLRVALTAGAISSVVASTEDCETAQLLINRLHDGEPVNDAEQEWLDEHLEECGKCRAARGMVLEVAASYRCWAPVALLVGMKADVLAQAGHVIGANWTAAHLSGAHAGGAHLGGLAKAPSGPQAAAGAVTAAAMAVIALVVLGLGKDDPAATRGVPLPQPAVQAKTPAHAAKAKAKAKPPEPIHPTPRVIPRHVTPPTARAGVKPPSRPAPRHAPAPAAKKPPAPALFSAPQPPAAGGPCSWPGHGNGPGGCPPGQGGTPPGHGGTPPGQAGTSTRSSRTPPGQGGTPPGQTRTPPGHGGTPPGQQKHA